MKSLIALCVSFLALGCASTITPPAANALMEARSGSKVTGSVGFTELSDGSVRVTVSMDNVEPGTHGFHVHEKGDCSAPDATSAGGHFNPTSHEHGAHAPESHAGDFGNLTADANGQIRNEFLTRSITLSPGATSAIGRAVVLHASADDLKTQPTGNSGGRIACGVITLVAP
ncbi:MAG: superoxide dismutase family protein [Thermoanaerobaculia bacterium]